MKKLFNLLCKNAVRIFWKSKWLFIQFILLLFLALTIFSSIFLSNSTLSDSINEVVNNGNLAAASVEDLSKKDNIKYSFELNKIPNLGQSDILNNDIFDPYNPSSLNWSDTVNISGIKVYNPMVEQQLVMGSKNELVTLYGFNYFTDNINQPTSSTGKELWPNLLYSKNDEFCIQINTLLTDSSYKDDLVNVFSFYKNVLQPNNLSDNFQELYLPEYYNYNPFKLYLKNNQFLSSPLSGGFIDGYYNVDNKDIFNLTFGVMSKKMGALVQYENSILQQDPPSNNQLYEYWKNIILNDPLTFSNNSLINFPLNTTFNSISEWEQWCRTYGDFNNASQYYSENLYNIYNKIPTLLNNNFVEPVGWLRFDYKFNPNESSGLSSYLYEQMVNNNISSEEAKELGYTPDDKELFTSTINIPLIPNITLLRNEPTNKETYKTELNDLSKYKDNWSINTNYVASILSDATSNLSLNLSKKNQEVILPKLSEATSEKLHAIYLDYLSKYDIEYNITSSGVKFTKTKTTNITSNSNQYIISEVSNNDINKYVIYEGMDISPILNQLYIDPHDVNKLIYFIYRASSKGSISYEEFIQYPTIFNIFKILLLSDYNNTKNTETLYKTTYFLSNKNNLMSPSQWNRYYDVLVEFSKNYKLNTFVNTGYGYKFRLTVDVGGISGMTIPMPGVYKTNNSSIIGLSTNYSKIKNGTYKIVDEKFVMEALKLPEFISENFNETIKNDPYLSANHYIYNPYTNKKEFYLSYDDWLQKLPNEYKLNISGEYYVISSIGTTPEFLYPIQNSNQMLLNNDVPVIYCNKNSYSAITSTQAKLESSRLWLEFPDGWTIMQQNNFINKINDFAMLNFGKKIAFYVNDSQQPNKLLYLRINFPNKILKIVTLATSFIGVVIGILAIFFISVLLRSIIKQNMSTISVLLSNGVSKNLIALSTFIYILLPTFISSLLGYIVSLFIFPIINGAVHDYWALDIGTVVLNFLPFLIMFLVSFVILFISLYLVIIWTLRKPVPTLLNTTVEFKMNKFIMWTKPMFRKANVMNSFRFSFMFGNFSRFLILTILMTSFASIFNVFTGSINMFQNSLQYTIDNNSSIDGKKEMAYSFDLTTPTPAGGYYYNINENELGSTSQGYTPFMDLNSEVSDNPYNNSYKDVLTYINPESGQSITYSQLGLIDITIINQISFNPKFFNNKVWTRLILDFEVNFLNQMINPWALAKANISSDLVSIADNKFNTQISDAFKYFLYLYSDEYLNNSDLHYINPNPAQLQPPPGYSYNPYEEIDPEFKYYWYVNSSDIKPDEKPNLIKDITKNGKISPNPADWNQSNWYYQCSLNLDGSYTWKLNSPYVTVGLPSFALSKDLAKLLTGIISLPINPDYKLFKNHINDEVKNLNTFFSTNTVPVSEGDGLYTYIDGTIEEVNSNSVKKFNINIKGINPKDTSIINLWYDNKNGNYMDLLDKYDQEYTTEIPQINNKDILDKVAMPYSDGTYPLIINKVVAKKYGYKKGDIITVRLNNMFDRHRMMNDNEEFPFGNFKIVGITESTSEEQFYTTQTIANSLLGLKKPIYTNLDSPEIKDGNFKNYWVNKDDVIHYTPFNGIMTNNINHPILNNSLTLYTESGLSPLDGWMDLTNGVDGAIRLSWKYMNKIFNYNIVNDNELKYIPTGIISTQFINKYIKLYGTNQFFLLNLKDVKSNLITSILGFTIDNTVINVFNILLISFVPTLIIILLLLSYIIILEARRLIALLKVLGFNNWINTITLIFSYFISVGISVLLSIGLSYGILFGLSELMFNFINVITYPSTPIWSHFVNIAVLLGLVFSLALMTYLKLKKTKPTEIIAVR